MCSRMLHSLQTFMCKTIVILVTFLSKSTQHSLLEVKVHSILFTFPPRKRTLHSLLTLLYDTAFSSYSLVQHCIFFQLPCTKTLHSLLTVLNDTAFSSNCILFFLQTAMYKDTAFSSFSGVQSCIFFKLPCTKTLHSLLTLGVKHQVIYLPFLCETLHSLHMSMSKDIAFSSHVHVQRYYILSHVHGQRHCTLFTCPWTPELSHQVLHSQNKQE